LGGGLESFLSSAGKRDPFAPVLVRFWGIVENLADLLLNLRSPFFIELKSLKVLIDLGKSCESKETC
jgi:hypothetical protein